MLFQRLLASTIRQGTLRLITANGKTHTYGNGAPPSATIRLHRTYLEWTLALYPQLWVAEAYMDGLLTVDDEALRDFMHIVALNHHNLKFLKLFQFIARLGRGLGRLAALNPLRAARKNASYHYDLDPRLYDLFLDSDRQYSCAYFVTPNVSLERAQQDKKRHIASKLFLTRVDLSVLDIGSGWGGLGLYLARESRCKVKGITLSHEQLVLSRKRAETEGLEHACRFELRDYRQEKGIYDRLVSVGMFEHVGARNYEAFFVKMRELLANDGVALLHSIGHFDACASVNPFINKHIFPGGEIPRLSDVLRAIDKSGLYVTDIEILRMHYAETLKNWYERFLAARDEAVRLYGEKFCRKWEFYLSGSEMSFRVGHLMVFQIQLAKRPDTLPVTRDYMHAWEDMAEGLPLPVYGKKMAAS